MSNSTGLIVAVIILLLIVYLGNSKTASFTVNKDQMYSDILDNKELFIGEHFSSLKRKITWMDAGIYTDVRNLIRSGNLNKQNFEIIFRRTV